MVSEWLCCTLHCDPRPASASCGFSVLRLHLVSFHVNRQPAYCWKCDYCGRLLFLGWPAGSLTSKSASPESSCSPISRLFSSSQTVPVTGLDCSPGTGSQRMGMAGWGGTTSVLWVDRVHRCTHGTRMKRRKTAACTRGTGEGTPTDGRVKKTDLTACSSDEARGIIVVDGT